MLKIGSVEIEQGQKKSGYLRVGSDTDGTPFNIPLLVVCGSNAGPTVWVEGCVHGGEFGGAASIISLYKELNPMSVSGTIIGVPVVNLPAYKVHSRISPIDGINLNRAFPGSSVGSYSQRLARKILDTIVDVADVVIDLHSGGIEAIVPHYAIYEDDGSETAKKSAWLAERSGVDVLWRVSGGETSAVSITAQTVANKIPSVTIENGGGAALSKEEEEGFIRSICNMLKALKVIEGEAPVKEKYFVVGGGDFLYTGEGGMFIPHSKVGARVNKGGLIAQVMNLYGEIVEEIRSGVDNGYILSIGSRYYPMEPGSLVAEVMTIEGYRGPTEI